ncbi:alpha/beta fold hydrolase [Qiania dongpingensis]|uniref:Alpha/beta hydrolase n=1 Tax=Qiania dongpingensis TaxID=2763669 RepID=A0A7G9G689_9FIRM|nr:alpha/beta hydrolase [Qiania dongpingensis]QNM06321.1 alpha/beta hydrolase [Qiania dongpingensis]
MSYFGYQGKKIYYKEYGEGKPVVFLHGNTASSRMFEPLCQLYEEGMKIILIDFLGHGRSDRLDEFPVDLWQEEARQTIALLEHLHCGKAGLVGTSGGAWAAVNAALERPDLMDRVAADSFDGRRLAEGFAASLMDERKAAKKDAQALWFYEWCQGTDWERVVDMDTRALVRCAEEESPLFCRPIGELQVPLFLLGSREDNMIRKDFEKEYEEIAKETGAKIRIFETGGHPAIYSNAEKAAEEIRRFMLEDN